MSYVADLECSGCSCRVSHRELQNLCPQCSSPLLVRYRLQQLKREFSRSSLKGRSSDMWRYLEVMPVESRREVVTLGEGDTPLLALKNLGASLGLSHLYLKDESANPTGSFKARGLSVAVTLARKLGAKKICIPTAGNAGGALAAYCARAGLEAFVFMPADTPLANRIEVEITGAHLTLVDGLIADAGRLMSEKGESEGWFDVSTLKEPYRIEGKKTLGYELAEQLDWSLPQVVLYPTGGGTGLIGMWKGFAEMEALGWLSGSRPRMVAVQSTGCAPIVKAFAEGAETSQAWPQASTIASGIRVPKALGDFLILRALRESRGTAVAVADEEIQRAIVDVASAEGVFLCPEGAACFAALQHLCRRGWIKPSERVVVFNTGSGYKYLDAVDLKP